MTSKAMVKVFYKCQGKHFHDFAQIMVPLGKEMSIEIEDEHYLITPQELVFIPQGMMHQCNYYGKILTINLEGGLVENHDTVLMSSSLIVSMKNQIVKLVELIQSEVNDNPQSQSLRFLLGYLYNKLLENCASPSIQYINQNYDLPITVEELARIESYNVTYYNNWFKQKTGFSPSLYLRNVRINKAKEYLATTRYSVMEIAAMVGYCSNSTFTRAFHNLTGMTPKAYRDCPCSKKAVSA